MPSEPREMVTASTDTTSESKRLWLCLRSRGTISEKVSSRSLTVEDIPSLLQMREATISANRPVARPAALALLEKLFQHYPPKALNAAAQKSSWEDWLEDVGHLPQDVLADACRAWRRADNKWAPAPGQLLALVDFSYQADEKLINMALNRLGHKISG